MAVQKRAWTGAPIGAEPLSPACGGGGSRAGSERVGSCQRKFSSDPACGERGILAAHESLGEPEGRLADDRIELRLPAPSDAAVLHRYASEDGGLDGVWVPLATGATRSACNGLIDDWLAGWGNLPSRQGPALVIVEAGHTDLIGQIGLGDRGRGVVKLLYGIAPRYRSSGYASAATRLVAFWLLEEGAASQIELRIDKDHVASQRVAVAASVTLVGTVESRVPATEETYEDLRFVMPATETHRQTL